MDSLIIMVGSLIGWELTRFIVEKPLLHNIISCAFLAGYLSYILGSSYLIYKLTKSTSEKTKEWSYEGKPWSYWKTRR